MIDNPDILIGRLKDITLGISCLLDDTDSFDQDRINQLNSLYLQRKEIIEDIKSFSESPRGKIYLSGNMEAWNNNMSDILTADKFNLDRISGILKNKEIALRAIRSQKSLLIYSKEESHGY